MTGPYPPVSGPHVDLFGRMLKTRLLETGILRGEEQAMREESHLLVQHPYDEVCSPMLRIDLRACEVEAKPSMVQNHDTGTPEPIGGAMDVVVRPCEGVEIEYFMLRPTSALCRKLMAHVKGGE